MLSGILRRPVLAIVISILIVFVGLLSLVQLPISQFPPVAPTTVNIFIAYPGASADVLIRSTIIPLEQAINGVPGMRYIISDATSAGEGTIQVVFEPGTDPDEAVVRVKIRVDQVMPLLPPLVQREGIIITPIDPSMLMFVNLYSTDSTLDEKFLYNYALTKMLPELQRIPGIARAQILGSRIYAMRVWLNPERMRAYNVSAEEVMEAMLQQSLLARPGRLGQSSGKVAQSLEYTLFYQDRYNKPQQYENIIIRANENGQILRLKDIARVELGSEFYDIYSNLNGYPATSIMLKQITGSNAQRVISQIKAKLREFEKEFPKGMHYSLSYDVSRFLDASIEEVISTLRDAFILVSLVVLLFLGDVRSTLVPIIAVPVSLIGSFFFALAFGLSINMVVLFSLVLAIGIVVDNAVVVLEAMHVKMELYHLSPYRAAQEVMREIGGAVIAITLVMVSVFVPIAFLSGPVGVFYRNFSVILSTSITLSGLVALTLTPVSAAMILRPLSHRTSSPRSLWGRFFQAFNRWYERLSERYVGIVKVTVSRPWFALGGISLFLGAAVLLLRFIPAGFVPNEDQGMIYAILQTAPGSTLEYTFSVARQLQEICKEIPEIETATALAGYEIMTEGRGSNAGTVLIQLKDWKERRRSVAEIREELEEKAKNLPAIVEFFDPPAVPGFGTSGGFSLRLLDKTGSLDYQAFNNVVGEFMDSLRKRPEITGLFTFYAVNYPQYELHIDNAIAMQKGVSIGKAMENLNILIGSTYEQGFIRFGRFFKVYVQSAPEFRRYPSDLLNLYVKNERGEYVPYSVFMHLEKRQGPNELTRYNLYNSAAIRGLPAPGYTTGDAIEAIQEVAQKVLPRGYDIAWEGLSYDEARRGNEALYIFLVVLFFVYLVLAAQYESFILPLAVILSLPPGIFGAFLFLRLMGLANDIFAQIALIMGVGLLGKNAVLVVEYALQRQRQGLSIVEAAVEGARMRLRPILMTSFAFVVGVIPLMLAHGAGALASRTVGTAAFGGMLVGTVVGVFFIPGLYYVFARLSGGRSLLREQESRSLTEELVEESYVRASWWKRITHWRTLLQLRKRRKKTRVWKI
jgi:HAE1 family hydrophobic/amphiphilic exporter-1